MQSNSDEVFNTELPCDERHSKSCKPKKLKTTVLGLHRTQRLVEMEEVRRYRNQEGQD